MKYRMSTVIGTAGNDTLQGSAGDDTIVGLQGNDTLEGFGGNDRLWGDDGNDVLDGGAGSDVFYGNDGNDTLFGGGNSGTGDFANYADHLYGGPGDDYYFHNFALGGVTVIDDMSGDQFGNADALFMYNATTLNLYWVGDRSTLYIFQPGEWDDGTFDNGIVIRGMLRNLGNPGVGTIEYAVLDGGQITTWDAAIFNSWDVQFA
ncbi:hypothetical protein D9623_18305 [Azospirillum brasilense]|jgi:Ca2+-binding RTX toxin-like protein|uniref:Calcium-binding protein n=2 Tax=Azospirillum brasilense TaxID=192 RepID=A0A4D8QP65_AZOBR|nr:hypothetical protein D3868_16140 [Azospirillum brasilense]QEL92066.1 hypothetical protein D9621_18065 [Azospirillum brasilense]QEL98368.1 hypothetical protein D9623_18305 [Azospirillum brasilense]TWB74834.1 hemolysin type calcium-binding protein [Azospirillum brasilense]